jgi:pimeloyl-ACP methyl ester carboxylesterase
MNSLKIMIIITIVTNSLLAMELERTAESEFEKNWPFQKLGTKYDDSFAQLAPILIRKGQTLADRNSLIEKAKNYVNDPERETSLPPDLKKALDANKNQSRKILNYVFTAYGWQNCGGSMQQAKDNAVIAFHGLGDRGTNFADYVKMLDAQATFFVPDFDDQAQKALNIGTELELLMGAYQYFSAKQQLQDFSEEKNPIEFLLGFSRGAGVIARLMSKFKTGQEPNGGFIMLAPFINPGATIGHVSSELSQQITGFRAWIPDLVWNFSLSSSNVCPEMYSDTIDINPSMPAVVKTSKPILILHGAKDQIIPFKESEKWAKDHAKIGNEIYYKTIPNKGHPELPCSSGCIALTQAFLKKEMKELESIRLK